MCEHCGCEAFGPLRELHADHLAILSSIGRLTDAVARADSDAVEEQQGALIHLLDRHDGNEELGIYGEIAKSDPGYVTILLAEHERIARLLRASPLTEEGMAEITDGLALLQHHISIEELDLFPYAMQVLTSVQWDLIERVQTVDRGPELPRL